VSEMYLVGLDVTRYIMHDAPGRLTYDPGTF
jgi:hypothetical protein